MSKQKYTIALSASDVKKLKSIISKVLLERVWVSTNPISRRRTE